MANYPNWDIRLSQDSMGNTTRQIKRFDLFQAWLKGLDKTLDYIMRIEPKKKLKTSEQLGYYHGIILKECVAEVNKGKEPKDQVTARELDAHFSKEFLTIRRDTPLEGVLSKGGLTTKEFASFVTQVMHHMVENYAYIVSEPNKEWKLKKRSTKE